MTIFAQGSFYDVVAHKAAVYPQKIALVDSKNGRPTTFATILDNAARVASYLSSRGVGRQDRVGVLARNCPAMVEVLLACARTGAIYVPYNDRLHPDEIRSLVADSDPLVLVHDGHDPDLLVSLERHLPPSGRRVFLGEEESNSGQSLAYGRLLREHEPDGAAPVPVGGGDPLAICYTGGTTGTPKGAVLTHGSMLANAVNTILGWGLREEDVALVVTPMYHTGGLNVLLTPLLVMGGTSVIAQGFDPDETLDLIASCAVTWVFMVPSMYGSIMASSRWPEADLESVRCMVTGGAPCPGRVIEGMRARGKRFFVGYGLTEAGPNNFFGDPDRAQDLLGLVGRPLPLVQTNVRDEQQNPCAAGKVGQLYLAGPHVFSGYWWRPEATSEVLEDGWLATGDLARVDEQGNHFIVGRIKEMYISGGENVYPAEVEEVLGRHPAVAEAAVVGVPDERWGETGLAAVVLVDGRSTDAEQLRRFCRDRIARYKVPSRYVFLDRLPRTGAGKVDRASIARCDGGR